MDDGGREGWNGDEEQDEEVSPAWRGSVLSQINTEIRIIMASVECHVPGFYVVSMSASVLTHSVMINARFKFPSRSRCPGGACLVPRRWPGDGASDDHGRPRHNEPINR